jgi:hypothetical protein
LRKYKSVEEIRTAPLYIDGSETGCLIYGDQTKYGHDKAEDDVDCHVQGQCRGFRH